MGEGDEHLLRQTLTRLSSLVLDPSQTADFRSEALSKLRIFYCELQDLCGGSSKDRAPLPVAAGKGAEGSDTKLLDTSEAVPKAGTSSKPGQGGEEGKTERSPRPKKHKRKHRSCERTPEAGRKKEERKTPVRKEKAKETRKEKKKRREETPEDKGEKAEPKDLVPVKAEKEGSLSTDTPVLTPVKSRRSPTPVLRERKREVKSESQSEEPEKKSEDSPDFEGSETPPEDREEEREDRRGSERSRERPEERPAAEGRRSRSAARGRRERTRTPDRRRRSPERRPRGEWSEYPAGEAYPPDWRGWGRSWWPQPPPAPASGPPGNFYPQRFRGSGKGKSKRERQRDIREHGADHNRKIWRKTRPGLDD